MDSGQRDKKEEMKEQSKKEEIRSTGGLVLKEREVHMIDSGTQKISKVVSNEKGNKGKKKLHKENESMEIELLKGDMEIENVRFNAKMDCYKKQKEEIVRKSNEEELKLLVAKLSSSFERILDLILKLQEVKGRMVLRQEEELKMIQI
ncbi:nucleotide exchange factor GrpE [Canna indica]|uniref:Nucleotide exchange factor GrpE n=1 Tax=Canna indica TaxID=4628 RepID=A0AAQ3QD96_9LILI|nr:nucleotide exchange factor GrpE [Canna indica]